jgi:hypothetical protein
MNYGQYGQQGNQLFGLQGAPPNRLVPTSSGLLTQPSQFSNLYPNRNILESDPQHLQKYNNNAGMFSNIFTRNNVVSGQTVKDGNELSKLQRLDGEILKYTEEYYTYLQQYEKYQLIEKAFENTLSTEEITQRIQNLTLLQKDRQTSAEQDQNKAHLEFVIASDENCGECALTHAARIQ